MSELIAAPVMQPEMILGLPWYIWGMVGLGFMIFLLIIVLMMYWYMMGPCRSYFKAQLNGEDITLFAQKSGKLKFMRSDYLQGVFNAMDLPLSWIQRSDDSFRFGKCMAKLVTDMTGICTEPSLNQAIKTWVYEWNERELRKEIYYKQQGYEYTPELVTGYGDLYEMIKSGRVDDPVVMPAVFEVPLWQIERYLAHIGPGDLEGHIAARVAEEAEKADSEAWPAWMKAFIAIEIGIVIVAIVAYMLGGA